MITPEGMRIVVPRTIDEQTFKLGKHKGRLFSEVAENDVDYCNMVQSSKKLSCLTATENGIAPIYGNFDGDTYMINDQNEQCSIFRHIPKHRLRFGIEMFA